MKKQKGYDAAKYEPMLNELVRLEKKGFKGIYNGDEQAIADAKKALECKRAILLANPLLDADKIVAARFKVGSKAHQIMTPSLGTQANNWSNQESAGREGFDARSSNSPICVAIYRCVRSTNRKTVLPSLT